MVPEKMDKTSLLAERIDIMIDSPAITETETIAQCRSAAGIHPASVWVKPCFLQAVMTCLRKEGIPIGTTIGCLDGATTSQIKVAEAKRALTEGATRLAISVNLGFVRAEQQEALIKDLSAVAGIAHMNGARVEAFFDPAFLDSNQILMLAQASVKADIDVLSFPVEGPSEDWDFSMVPLLLQKMRAVLLLKGLVTGVKISDSEKFFDHGLDFLAIRNLIVEK
jgi:deoxyribose-phosphate aldolase